MSKPKLIIVFLMFLSPALGELLSSSTPPFKFFNPLALAVLMSFYGGGTLLIREARTRWDLHWPVLFLAVAYGILEEGTMMQSFFNPNHAGTADQAGHRAARYDGLKTRAHNPCPADPVDEACFRSDPWRIEGRPEEVFIVPQPLLVAAIGHLLPRKLRTPPIRRREFKTSLVIPELGAVDVPYYLPPLGSLRPQARQRAVPGPRPLLRARRTTREARQ
jgi:hypothetical protein